MVGIFQWDSISGKFFAQILRVCDMLFQLNQEGLLIFNITSFHHRTKEQGRIGLVRRAIEQNADKILFLDAKRDIDVDTIDLLIASEKDVIVVNKNNCLNKKERGFFPTEDVDWDYTIAKTETFKNTPSKNWFISKGKKTYKYIRYFLSSFSQQPSQIIVKKDEDIDVLIGIPVAETVSGQFFGGFLEILNSLFNRAKADKDFSFAIYTIFETEIDIARKMMIDEARRLKAREILFLDSDSIVSSEVIHKMIDREEDVVSAVTVKKMPPYYPVVLKQEDGYLNYQEDFEANKGVQEANAIGMACTSIKTKVFDDIKEPYFKFTEYILPDGSVEWEGEDIYFSRKIQKAGHKIYVDTDCLFGHFGKIATIEDYNAFYRKELMYLKQCRQEALESLKLFFDKKYTRKQLKIQLMKMRAKVKEKGLRESDLTSEEWLCERADWHLWGDQWHIDQDLAKAIVVEMQGKEKCFKVLCLDRGIGQLPYMLSSFGAKVDCLFTAETASRKFMEFRGLNIVELSELKKDYYDAIVMIDWFEHLDDEEFYRQIDSLRGILKAGGKFCMKTASHNDRHQHYEWTEDRKKTILDIGKKDG